jgi:hypothetical protein
MYRVEEYPYRVENTGTELRYQLQSGEYRYRVEDTDTGLRKQVRN